MSVCVRKCACAHTQFRLMHSHVGNGGGEKVTNNPQAESHTYLTKWPHFRKRQISECKVDGKEAVTLC